MQVEQSRSEKSWSKYGKFAWHYKRTNKAFLHSPFYLCKPTLNNKFIIVTIVIFLILFVEDIQVVFSHNGWEALGDFSSPDVHRQVIFMLSLQNCFCSNDVKT